MAFSCRSELARIADQEQRSARQGKVFRVIWLAASLLNTSTKLCMDGQNKRIMKTPKQTTNYVLGLIVLAAFLNGLLTGGNVDRLLIASPAWERVGFEAWAEFSRNADLGISSSPVGGEFCRGTVGPDAFHEQGLRTRGQSAFVPLHHTDQPFDGDFALP